MDRDRRVHGSQLVRVRLDSNAGVVAQGQQVVHDLVEEEKEQRESQTLSLQAATVAVTIFIDGEERELLQGTGAVNQHFSTLGRVRVRRRTSKRFWRVGTSTAVRSIMFLN